MAQIWEYIATYNPQGFYEDNRAKMLNNDINTARLGAIQKQNRLEDLILGLKQRVAQGDTSALKELGVYSPETTKKYIENTDEMLNLARPLAQAVLKASPENREKVYKQMLSRLTSQNVDVSDMPQYYDEDTISFIANSDPQAIRDERLNEYQTARDERINEYQTERDYRLDKFNKENATIDFGRDLEKLKLQSELTDQRDEKNFNRDLQKLQYAYDRADAKEQRAAEFVMDNMKSGIIPKNEGIKAFGKILGVDIDSITPADRLRDEFFNPETTPERRSEISSMLKDWTLATNTSKSGIETPSQTMERYHKSGFTPESSLQAVLYNDPSLLVPDTTPKGSTSANSQGNDKYNQWLKENPDASSEEKRNARAQFGVMNYDDQMALNLGKIDAQNQGRLEVVDRQGQNAINLEDRKQQNREVFAFLNDQISQGKELRDLNNKKAFEEFKNTLPTEHALELMNIAKYMTEQGRPTTYEELAAREYGNALRAKQYENEYKNAQTQKMLAELPYVGKTTQQQNFEYLTANNIPQDVALDKAFGSKGTTVNVGSGEPEFTKQMAKNDSNSVKEIETEITNLDKHIGVLEQTEAAVRDPSLYQGTIGDVVNDFRTLLASVGVDVRGLDSAAILNTGSSMLMGNLRKDLMPGPLSDRDLMFLIRMTPALTKTPKQNAAILNMYKKMYQRQRDVLNFKAQYGRSNNTLNGVQEAIAESGLDKPVFTEKEKAMASGTSKNSYREGDIVRNAQGEELIYRGGKWQKR